MESTNSPDGSHRGGRSQRDARGRQFHTNMSGSRTSFSGSASWRNQHTEDMVPGGWKQWPELSLRLDGLPTDVTTKLLFDWFSPQGTLVWIDIYTRGRDMRHPEATEQLCGHVKFSPPPEKAFWETGNYFVSHPQYPEGLSIRIKPPNEPPQKWNRSRLHKERVYPLRMNFHPKSLDFGVPTGEKSMKVMKTICAEQQDRLRIDVDVQAKKLEILFPVPGRNGKWYGPREFKMVVDIRMMKNIQHTTLADGSCALVLPLRLPPKYYWKNSDIQRTLSEDPNSWAIANAWSRATDIAEDIQAPLRYPVAIHNQIQDPQYMEIGRWTMFRFILASESNEAKASIQELQDALEDLNIIYETCPDFKLATEDGNTMWSQIDYPPIPNGASASQQLLMLPVIHLQFEVRYQLEVCISRGILNDHTIKPDFLRKLAELDPVKARLRLEYLADQNEPLHEPMSLFENQEAEAFYYNPRIPYYCALVRKAIVTPTTVRFSTPNAETSNRVIRKYSQLQDRFLRVQFLEESEKSKIGSAGKNKSHNDALYIRVMRTLYQGIQIGERKYEFLAFGNSQLRECGAYFFCPTKHTSCDDIRKWMGHFAHIKVVAKHAARLGQCFSTTREIRGIQVPRIHTIPDIDRNGHCFTDGVGVISDFLAQVIIGEMHLDVFDKPSAFQFRMGGCKGVLTVWPQAKGMEVHIRDSQKKFEADFKGLEIIRCAKFVTATLNRQTITILESLGVPQSIFVNLLDRQIRRFEKAMKDKNAAVELLSQFVDENQITLILAAFLKADFKSDVRNEPFVTSVLHLWRSWSLKLLKEKARISVDHSAFVLGCVDETGSLRGHDSKTEGSAEQNIDKLPQIFLQISDSKIHNQTHIIEGVCIVGRNPSLHPGDIRVVQAVDEPRLHHLKDVVVFPSTGDRPVPNMLSGGDLDGDDFFVIWDKNLIPPKEWNYPPMKYSVPKPKEISKDVTIDHIRDFFVSYMRGDVLPLVATAHLAFADLRGPKSQDCLMLAELHSQAVDFPKTGQPVDWIAKYEPRHWPHFMDKSKTKSYISRKTLGVIYDKVCRQPIEFVPDWESNFDERVINRFKLDIEILEAASKIKSQYDTSVRRILTQHSIETEFELWTGFAMSRPAVGSDYKRQEYLGREYDTLKQRFRALCYDAAGGHNPDKIDPFVAAMYKVTEEQMKAALFEHNQKPVQGGGGRVIMTRKLSPQSMPLISFPWIFHWVMLRIVSGGKYDPKNTILAHAIKRDQFQPTQGPMIRDDGTTKIVGEASKPATNSGSTDSFNDNGELAPESNRVDEPATYGDLAAVENRMVPDTVEEPSSKVSVIIVSNAAPPFAHLSPDEESDDDVKHSPLPSKPTVSMDGLMKLTEIDYASIKCQTNGKANKAANGNTINQLGPSSEVPTPDVQETDQPTVEGNLISIGVPVVVGGGDGTVADAMLASPQKTGKDGKEVASQPILGPQGDNAAEKSDDEEESLMEKMMRMNMS